MFDQVTALNASGLHWFEPVALYLPLKLKRNTCQKHRNVHVQLNEKEGDI